MKSVYVTDSRIMREGHGGSVVSFHELNALSNVTEVQNIYQHVGTLFVEEAYPNNPFMRDYYTASLIEHPDEIDIAKFYGSAWTLTMKRLSKAKIIVTVAAHNLEASLEEWRISGLELPIHLANSNLFDLLCRGLTEEADIIICPSTTSAEYLASKLHVEKPIVIPHGTDLPSEWSSERELFTVSNVGACGPDKGLQYLAQAWILGNFKGQLVFAGSTIHVEKPTSILSLGYISEAQKHELYAKTSVYVASSVTEGFGITVLEAMAHGTPIIVTEGVGAKDCVTDGHDGFVVPIKNSKAIAEKLLYYQDNPSEVKRMGRNARATAERYSWENIEKQYENLFREAL